MTEGKQSKQMAGVQWVRRLCTHPMDIYPVHTEASLAGPGAAGIRAKWKAGKHTFAITFLNGWTINS